MNLKHIPMYRLFLNRIIRSGQLTSTRSLSYDNWDDAYSNVLVLTRFNSRSISAARMTSGPRTAYSINFTFGFIVSMLIEGFGLVDMFRRWVSFALGFVRNCTDAALVHKLRGNDPSTVANWQRLASSLPFVNWLLPRWSILFQRRSCVQPKAFIAHSFPLALLVCESRNWLVAAIFLQNWVLS